MVKGYGLLVMGVNLSRKIFDNDIRERRVDVVYCKIGVCCSCCSVAVQNMVYEK